MLKLMIHDDVIVYSLLAQRRLSVAIAAIGEPPIVFLDEPTSGLDPKNRRSIWKMISMLRQTSLVVLTTHSMEEADTLGDKICILALGRLRAIGTSTHLKNRFGYGYHINLVVPPHRSAEAKEKVLSLLPEIHLDTETAGNLSYSLERARIEDVSNFFRFVESEISKDESGRLILDWGLSQTTMEEVFLRLTHGDTRARAEQQEEMEKKMRRTGFYTDNEKPPVRTIAVPQPQSQPQSQPQPLPPPLAPPSSSKDFEALRRALEVSNAQNQQLAMQNAQLLARLQALEAMMQAKQQNKQ